MGYDRPADDKDPGGGLAPSPQLACRTAGGLRGSPHIMNITFIPLRSGSRCAWASLSEAPSGTQLPFLPPLRWPLQGVRSRGSPAPPGLWEKGHRK